MAGDFQQFDYNLEPVLSVCYNIVNYFDKSVFGKKVFTLF